MDDRTFEIVGELVAMGAERGVGMLFAPEANGPGWTVSALEGATVHELASATSIADAVYEALLSFEPVVHS